MNRSRCLVVVVDVLMMGVRLIESLCNHSLLWGEQACCLFDWAVLK